MTAAQSKRLPDRRSAGDTGIQLGERANLEKKPSMRLSQEPCLGVKVKAKRPRGREASQALVTREICAE
jgi:hypothetical protein